MSKIDDVFGPIPGPAIKEWGTSCTFIKKGEGTYDAVTGQVINTGVTYAVMAVMLDLDKTTSNLYQEEDFKILLDAEQIGDQYMTTNDLFRITFDGVSRDCKIVDIKTYRGDKPIFFTCIVRPQ